MSATRALFGAIFFLSGAAALTYQVVWQRVLTQAIGSDAVSVALTVALFMVWLALGAELARRLLASGRIAPAAAYALVEVAVGVYGFFSVPLLRHANEWAAGLGATSLLADAALNFAVLGPPVAGMGMTTPLVIEIAKRSMADLGRTSGAYYGINIAGAAAGALLCGLVLVESFGLQGTAWLAACTNIGIGLAMGVLMRGRAPLGPRVDAPRGGAWSMPPAPAVAAVLFGFGTLSIQLIFFRVLSNYFTLSTVVFPAMLGVYLLLMAAGQYGGGRLADRYPQSAAAAVAVMAVSGCGLLLLALAFPPSAAAKLGVLAFTSFNGSLLDPPHRHLVGDPAPLTVVLFSAVFMSAVVAWSALFPLMLRLVTRHIGEAGERFASLYTLYTVGNVAGVLACGFALMPAVGTEGAARVTMGVVGLGALALLLHRRDLVPSFALAVAVTGAAVLVPREYYKGFSLDRYRVVDVHEGRTGVVTVVPSGRFYTIIDMNRTASASALARDPQPGDLYEAWRWNHAELLAVDPRFRPKQVLVIGIGHAYLIAALLDLPSIERITVVEISEEIVRAVKRHSSAPARRIFADPRVEIVIADGRRYVQKALAQGRRYDLIQNKINEPWHAGSGNLFTLEFFEAERRLLAPGGYLGVRPLGGHLADGYKVFGNAIHAPGHYHMYFKNGPVEIPAEAVITQDIRTAWFAGLPGGAARTAREPQLKVAFVGGAPAGRIDHNTDDRPTFEYYWLRQRLGTWRSPRETLSERDLSAHLKTVAVRELGP